MAQEIRNRRMSLVGDIPITKILTIEIVGEVNDYEIRINGILVTSLTHTFPVNTIVSTVVVSSPTKEFNPVSYTSILMDENKTLTFTVKVPLGENYIVGFTPITFNDWKESPGIHTPPATYETGGTNTFFFNTGLKMKIGSEIAVKVEQGTHVGIVMRDGITSNWWGNYGGIWLNRDLTLEFWIPDLVYVDANATTAVGRFIAMRRASRTLVEIWEYAAPDAIPVKISEREIPNSAAAGVDNVNFTYVCGQSAFFSYPQGKDLITV